jgi:hypothetical protein
MLVFIPTSKAKKVPVTCGNDPLFWTSDRRRSSIDLRSPLIPLSDKNTPIELKKPCEFRSLSLRTDARVARTIRV